MRRITRAIVTRIALCKRGKNNLETIFKSKDGQESLTFNSIIRKSGDEGSLLAVVYAPSDMPDDDGQLADNPKVIEQSAHEFLRDHRQLDIEHDGNILAPDAAYVAESFIIGKGDERFKDWKDYDGNPVDVTGGWAVRIQIDDPNLRAAYRDGDWDGVSMFGLAATEPVEKSNTAASRVLDRLLRRSIEDDSTTGESPMDEQLLQLLTALTGKIEALAKSVETAPAPLDAKAIAEALATVMKGDDNDDAEPEDVDPLQAQIDALEKPKFPEDISSPTAMQAFAKSQRAYELQVSQIKGELSSDQLEEMVKSMTASVPTDDECGIENEDTPRERELKRQLFEMAKSRNAADSVGDEEDEVSVMRKSRSKFASRISGAFNQDGAKSSFKVKAN